MTLTEIKEKIIAQLGQMTIDDFLLDYNIATKVFTEAAKDEIEQLINSEHGWTKWKNKPKENVYSKVLIDKYYESTYEYFEKVIDGLYQQKSVIQEQIDSLTKGIAINEKLINEKNEQLLKTRNEKEARLKSISEQNKEIETLKPLADKAPYNSQVNDLENTKNLLNRYLEESLSNISVLENELKELDIKNDAGKEKISEFQSKIDEINYAIAAKEQARKAEPEKSEYAALEFLCVVLFYVDITRSSTMRSSYSRMKNLTLSFDENIFQEKDCEFGEVLQFVTEYLKETKFTIPKDWRRILFGILASPIPDVIGAASGGQDGRTTCFTPGKVKLTHLDVSFLLALKIAVKSNYSIYTLGGKITLGLSGGASATISFRNKDERYSKIQKQDTEFYANCFFTDQYAWRTLYSQSGYASSRINIEMPYGYYILTPDYVIDVEFSPASILFDSNNISRLVPNISIKAMREDEAEALAAKEKHKREEEEEARRRYLDDDDD
jgi:hypothetical protein